MQTPYSTYVEELEAALPLLSTEKLSEIHNRVSSLSTEDSDIQALVDFIEILSEGILASREETKTMLSEKTI